MGEKMDISKKKCVTPEARASFPALLKPKSFQNQEPKYSLVLLFPKKTDLSRLKECARNAAIEKWGPKDKWPKKLRWPFRDGDEKEDLKGYEDCIFVTASSKHQPGLVDKNLEAILSEEDFYAGCYCRAEVIAFAYDQSGNKGVSFSLQNVQKLRDGEKFSGRKDAAEVFDKVEDDSDDPSNYGDDDSDDGDNASMGF